MKKLLQRLDNHLLKIGVIFTSLFVVLYPKLPSIYITHTWVYIRLEDFVIAALILLWVIQLLRKKARLALPLGIPILIYWVVGLASVAYSVVFIGPHLAGYFPKLVALEYIRRIEYMVLFFIGFSAIKSRKDLKQFVVFMLLGTGAIVLYGFGQHFYPYFWRYLPQFIQKTNFCFPSFQTGNEEFAKGIPLCLPVGSRVTSTFGGHYDLAGYLIIVLPVILGIFLFVKGKLKKSLLGILFLTGLITLILTSSRSAFLAYLFAVVVPLIFLKKKKFIPPVLLVSLLCLVLFSASTINRFMQTFRITSVVVNMQGQVVGLAENSLSQNLQNQLQKNNSAIQANEVVQGVVPEGSSFITLPQQRVATSTAVVQQGISGKAAERLQLANGGLELSTVKGNFSVQKALVYDISVTTRLQGEWPNAIAAFVKYPLLGKGYSTLTLAVDNDFLRLLGESGILGFIAFVGVFVMLGIYARQLLPFVDDPLVLAFVYGVIGGIIGLFVNATLFDIFESSKVAETLWILTGIAAGSLALYKKKPIAFRRPLVKILTSTVSLYVYFFAATLLAFWTSISQFFIGDDFVWLKWAAVSTFQSIPGYFTNANGFFYRPLDKVLMLLFYSLFAFQPQGYHVVVLLLHFFMAVGMYTFVRLLLKQKVWAFVGAMLFLLLPMHMENVFWISSLSIDLSAVLMLFVVITYLKSGLFPSWMSPIRYVLAIILTALALTTYELALVVPLLLLLSDVLVVKKISWKRLVRYVPFVLLDVVYLFMRAISHAVSAGGDYSYSLVHLLPNIVGNLVGYVGLFLFGEWSLPVYTALRVSTKHFALPIVALLIALLSAAIYMLRNQNWKKFFKKYSLPVFAAGFSLIALLPYIGLGNIAERYGYLASVGLVLLAVLVGKALYEKIAHKNTRLALTVIIAVGVFVFCVMGISKGYAQWGKAAKITYNTLGYFKIEYPSFPQNSTVIIVNRPIRYANAWVFPTGLPEGLWFVYGNQMPSVLDALSIPAAKHIAATTKHAYIFTFTKNYEVKKVQ